MGILFLVEIRFFPSSRSVFLFISPLLFDPPKTTLFHICPVFLPPKHLYVIHKIPSQRRAINNKRGSIDNTYIKRKLRINKKKTTCKTRKNNAQNTKKTSEIIQKISNVFRKKSNVLQEISHVFWEKSNVFHRLFRSCSFHLINKRNCDFFALWKTRDKNPTNWFVRSFTQLLVSQNKWVQWANAFCPRQIVCCNAQPTKR